MVGAYAPEQRNVISDHSTTDQKKSIVVNELSKAYQDQEYVLSDVSFEIEKGDVVAIIGPSGSGKSTLIRCLNLLEQPTSGDVQILGEKISSGGRNVQKKDLQALRSRVGMVFQSFNLFPHMTALENVNFAQIQARGRSKKVASEKSYALLERVGLSGQEYKRPAQLSGGQQQRVAIARSLAVDPEVMLFDEPTSAIDPERRYEVLKVMKELAAEGMTMVIVTHEIQFARQVANRVMFLNEGSIVESGRPEDILRQPKSERLQQFLSRVEEIDI